MQERDRRTILIPSDLHERIERLAEKRHSTADELVRLAVEQQYGSAFEPEPLEAVRTLGELNLPVGSAEEMEKESI